MDDKLWEVIDSEYKAFEVAENYSAKLNHICTIIELKKQLTVLKSSLYSDIRKYLSCSIEAHEEKNLDYYKINYAKIRHFLSELTHKEQVSLLKFFTRLLKQKGLDEDWEIFHALLKKTVIQGDFKSKNVVRYFHGLLLLTSYNLLTVSITILLIFICYTIVLLPAPYESWVVFDLKYINLASDGRFNQCLNLLLYLFGFNDEIKITPLDWKGVLLAIIGKCFLFTVIINYLLREFLNKLKIG